MNVPEKVQTPHVKCVPNKYRDLLLEKCNKYIYLDQAAIQHRRGDCSEAFKSEKRVLDIRLRLFGAEVTQHSLGDYISVLEPKKHIRRKLFGEEHSETADSYLSVAATQHPVGDYNSALEFKKDALEIRRKLFGEEHPTTTCSYHSVGVTQHSLADYMSALESKKRALYIRWNLFGEGYSETADSYHSVGVLHIIHWATTSLLWSRIQACT
ncbi:hypothetical protein ACROYT_G041941 [Oculina patagonica]